MYLALKRNYVPCRSKRKEDIKDHNDQKDQRTKKNCSTSDEWAKIADK